MYQRPYYSLRKHHYIEWIIIIILLAIIGFGGYHMFNTPVGHDITQQASSKLKQKNHQISSSHNDVPVTKAHHTTTIMHSKSHQSSTLQNKPGYTLSIFPSNIQGTWYSYDDGKLETLVITPTSASFNGHVVTIHARSRKAPIPNKPSSKTNNWATAIPCNVRGLHFSEVRGWSQSAGDGVSYAEFNTNGVTVLDEAGGAEFATDANFYKTKAIAKQNKKNLYKSHGEKSDGLD